MLREKVFPKISDIRSLCFTFCLLSSLVLVNHAVPSSAVMAEADDSSDQRNTQTLMKDYRRQNSADMPFEAHEMQTEQSINVPGESFLGAGMRMTVSLLLVLALISAGVFLLRKIAPYKGFATRVKQPASVLSKVALGPRKSIVLVRIANEILVIGVTNNGMSLLSKMDSDEFHKEGNIPVKEAYTDLTGHRHSFRKLLDKIYVRNQKTSTNPNP